MEIAVVSRRILVSDTRTPSSMKLEPQVRRRELKDVGRQVPFTDPNSSRPPSSPRTRFQAKAFAWSRQDHPVTPRSTARADKNDTDPEEPDAPRYRTKYFIPNA